MNPAVLRAFLDDVKADPFDDAPRLILADWLEDHAGAEAVHARGLLLRLQCEAAARSEFDPDARAMRRQASELLALYEQRWLGDFADVPDVEARFVRGLLHLTLSGPELLSPALRAASPASWQWVEGLTLLARMGGLDTAETAEVLREVTRLEILQHHTVPEWVPLLDAGHLTRVVDLTLVDHRVNDYSLGRLVTLQVLPRLRRLALRVGEVTGPGWAVFARSPSLARLEALTLSHCNMLGRDAERLAASPHLARLRHLDLGYNRIEGDFALPNAPALTRLVLAGNPLGTAGAAALAAAPLTALRHLGLGDCQLDVAALAAAGWLAGVETLDLRNVNLTESGPALLGALASVRVLRLAGCGLTPDALAALSLPHLRELHLRDNLLGDAGVAALVRSELPALRVLNLDAARITDAGLRHLADWPGLADLWLLSLDGNDLTPAGVQYLADSEYRSPATRIELE